MREILKGLSEAFGPSGYEDRVRELIKEYISKDAPSQSEIFEDKVGNLYFHMPNEGKPRLMINAHMDEVGFMVRGITDKGYLKIGCVGGMSPLVLGAKTVVSERGIKGVIASKPIHLLSSLHVKNSVGQMTPKAPVSSLSPTSKLKNCSQSGIRI